MSLPIPNPNDSAPRFAFAKLIEAFNPGVTFLVALWVSAFETRKRLLAAGHLEQLGDDALKSLILVIPIMLVGWAVLHVADKRYRLGIFR